LKKLFWLGCRLTTLILSLCLLSGFSQTFTPCLKSIEFSEKEKETKKVTSIEKALENPSKVYHLKVFFNDYELDSFFNNVSRFENLQKLEIIHAGVNRELENIPDSFYRFLPNLELLVFWVESKLQLKNISQLNRPKLIEANSSSTKQIPEELYNINSLECLQFSSKPTNVNSSFF